MYFLDTNVLIYYLKDMHFVRNTLMKRQLSEYKIPSIVKAELLTGANKSNKRIHSLEIANDLLSYFEIIPFDDKASICFSNIKYSLESKGNIIGPYDLIIAATVLAHNGILYTNNVKEFNRVKGLNVESIIPY